MLLCAVLSAVSALGLSCSPLDNCCVVTIVEECVVNSAGAVLMRLIHIMDGVDMIGSVGTCHGLLTSSSCWVGVWVVVWVVVWGFWVFLVSIRCKALYCMIYYFYWLYSWVSLKGICEYFNS